MKFFKKPESFEEELKSYRRAVFIPTGFMIMFGVVSQILFIVAEQFNPGPKTTFFEMIFPSIFFIAPPLIILIISQLFRKRIMVQKIIVFGIIFILIISLILVGKDI